ncbi:hypothetical protein B566_EDAN009618 [Ephemera danica]|nr:hypothetical protein B566_EDAN009618 [Ephemera danica]
MMSYRTKQTPMSSQMLLCNSVQMKDEADLNQHVHVGDVLAACRGVRLDVQAVLSYQVARTSVQGFTSLILHVVATVLLPDCSTAEIKLVLKRLPMLENQLKTIQKDIVPLLTQRSQQLPLAKCYLAQGTTTILEDLNETGYVMLTKDMKDMGREGVMGLAEARLVVRRLAQFHVASMFKVLPQIKSDPMFMGPIDKTFIPILFGSCRTTAIAMCELLPHCTRHADWLLSGTNCFNTVDRLARPSIDELNVLCHGDCHVNNMIFKYDKNGKPVDVKFLDMQLVRYGPPSCKRMWKRSTLQLAPRLTF